MALLIRLASPLKTLLRRQTRPAIGGIAATEGYHTATSPGDFDEPVDTFVTKALAAHGLGAEAEAELAALHDEKVLNMGILKMCDLDEVAKTVIARALANAKTTKVAKTMKLERESSRKIDRKRTI